MEEACGDRPIRERYLIFEKVLVLVTGGPGSYKVYLTLLGGVRIRACFIFCFVNGYIYRHCFLTLLFF